MFNPDELNEVASLLHITSEIATNHPNLSAIARACQRRLREIESDLLAAEAEEVEKNKQAKAEREARDYVAPKPGDPNYIRPEKDSVLDKPIETFPDPNANVEVERRV